MDVGNRKLVAILFSDIVGYSAISSANESLALKLLKQHRELSRPIIAAHSGTEIKTIGDAFLLTFDNALNAVKCGVALLDAHRGSKIRLRIGIHLGDIVFTENDVYGDGVNTASRLQAMAKPGTLCLSGSVYYQVSQHIRDRFYPLGMVSLKNIASKVALYSLAVDPSQQDLNELRSLSKKEKRKLPQLKLGFALSTVSLLGVLLGVVGLKLRSAWEDPSRQNERVAVLTLDGIGLAADDRYLVEGLTEEINNSLIRLGKYRVLARGSVKPLETLPTGEIAKRLAVSSLVRGSIHKENQKILITLQLINAITEEIRWSRTFEGNSGSLFKLQRELAGTLGNSLWARPGRSLASVQPDANPTPNAEAYEHYLRAKYLLTQRTANSILQAQRELKRSIELDPNFAQAYAAMTNASSLSYYYGGLTPVEAGKRVFEFGNKTLELDPANVDARISMAEAHAYIYYDWKKAELAFRKAIEDWPDHAIAHQWFSEFLAARGRFKEAYLELDKARALDPVSIVLPCAVANVRFQGGDYETSMAEAGKVLDFNPNMMIAHYWYGKAAFEMGRKEMAIQSLSRAVELSDRSSMTLAALGYVHARSGQPEKARAILAELRAYKNKKYYSSYDIAMLHAGLGEVDSMILALRNAYNERASYLPLIKNDPVFKRYLSVQVYRDFLDSIPF